ncbi:transcriptional regulator MerR family protein [Vibrio ichthyoenteri ATCC 700023]|uniref:Transcriptional regulator MerR family protein n=1 Tax=Vibrio ichthyoenteri ATCC 700023 TaxID=870968 RepID=F9RX27_9VIBR|nr:MerR family transcriptional regulator [Vibrio ichthyoenteri]EGU48456.1 transcriptional regulator MerR family protein [Vibrio ichthyoenteri ATCC 700023]
MGCEEKLYAIREVSELTGIKPVTLRAWQRRYNIIQPQRTEKGHRLYTYDHIEQIRVIQGWLEKGVAIGKVKALLESGQIPEVMESDVVAPLDEVETTLGALAQLNRHKSEATLSLVFKEYPMEIIESRYLQPIFDSIAQVKRSQQTLQIGMFQSLLLSRLTLILEAENKAARNGKCLLVSYDSVGSIEMRLWALGLVDRGYSISFIEGVEDLSGLSANLGLDKYAMLAVYASQAPSKAQLPSIEELSHSLGSQLTTSPLITTLMAA